MTTSPAPFGCDLTPITESDAEESIAWLQRGTGPCTIPGILPVWAVVQSPLAFGWGVYRDDLWHWSWNADPTSEELNWDQVLEVRLFEPKCDLLLWREGAGYRGRLIQDGPSLDPCDPRRPLEREAFFEPHLEVSVQPDEPNDRDLNDLKTKGVVPGTPFVIRRLWNGRTTITPAGEGVHLVEYLSETFGILRIAATRFVEVK